MSLAGCALTDCVKRKAKSRYEAVKDDSPEGWHLGPEPQPAYAPLLFIAIPVDVVTFPLQVPFWFCIAQFNDWNM